MLYRKTLLITSLSLLVLSCQYNGDNSTHNEKENIADTLSYAFEVISKELPCKEKSGELCLDVKIKEIRLKGGSSEIALKKMEENLKKATIDTDNSPEEAESPEQLAENLVAEYRRITTEMPDYSMPWSYERNLDVFLNEQKLFGVQLDSYSYTGGAHGNYFTFYYLFHTVAGERITLHQLLKHNAILKLNDLAEQQFRDSRGLKGDMDLNEAGYWFEENIFRLPENFKYSRDGLEFRYNPYEVAPYSEGEITLIFPFSSVKDLIKPEYLIVDIESKKEVL